MFDFTVILQLALLVVAVAIISVVGTTLALRPYVLPDEAEHRLVVAQHMPAGDSEQVDEVVVTLRRGDMLVLHMGSESAQLYEAVQHSEELPAEILMGISRVSQARRSILDGLGIKDISAAIGAPGDQGKLK